MKTRLSDILHGNHFLLAQKRGSEQENACERKLPVKMVMQNCNRMYSNQIPFDLKGVLKA